MKSPARLDTWIRTGIRTEIRLLFGIVALLAIASGCRGCNDPPRSGRSTPVCAVQDCATGKILDNGCADDGKCVSCVNPCPPPAGQKMPTTPAP